MEMHAVLRKQALDQPVSRFVFAKCLRAQLVGFEPYKHNNKKIIDNARWINANVNEYMK